MVISIALQKGGTGKTTTSLARRDKRVLLVDADHLHDDPAAPTPHHSPNQHPKFEHCAGA
jgi:Mrp family chromosome partitioning ATPase